MRMVEKTAADRITIIDASIPARLEPLFGHFVTGAPRDKPGRLVLKTGATRKGGMKDLMDAMREDGVFAGGQAPDAEISDVAAACGCGGSDDDVSCCGSKSAPPASPDERPGYVLCGFVEGFRDTPAGRVPRIKTSLDRADLLGALKVRLGPDRDDYRVAPGLYCVGEPGEISPVLVSANYKLSFDALRKELSGVSAWILVLDTRGVNVWCAAGKQTFSTDEAVSRVRASGLDKIAPKAPLILPQLAATGVCAKTVGKRLGRKAIFGPLRARDVRAFLDDGMKAEAAMRRVTFTLAERAVLTPVEFYVARKQLFWAFPVIFLASGLGSWGYSLSQAVSRGAPLALALLCGALAGTVATPLALPLLPGRALALKGALAGALAGLASLALYSPGLRYAEGFAALVLAVGASSYGAMNFTGATPYCSPSGVEKEMRRFIPLQAGAVLLAAVIWLGAAFMS